MVVLSGQKQVTIGDIGTAVIVYVIVKGLDPLKILLNLRDRGRIWGGQVESLNDEVTTDETLEIASNCVVSGPIKPIESLGQCGK